MRDEDQYLKFVRWEAEDNVYVGFCPDLFPWGGVCHGSTEEDTYKDLCSLVREEVNEIVRMGRSLPPSSTRPMRDAISA